MAGLAPDDRDLRLRQLYKLFIPLAFSGAFFPVARPVINAALARTEDGDLAIAAYSVALSITLPLAAPLFGMRQITTALCVDQNMIRRLGRLVLYLGSAATGIILLLSLPPVYLLLTDRILGIPQEIARLGPPAMLLLATYPLLMIGRGFYQGILVHYGRANSIGVGAFGYLAGCCAGVFAAVLWLDLAGAVAAALAMLVGNLIYILIVAPPARSLYARQPALVPTHAADFAPQKRSMRYILSLYHPLATSAVLTTGVEPLVQAAMAHSLHVTESLAAYAVCVSVVWLLRTNLWNTQQVVIARVRGRRSYAAVRRFVMSLSWGTMAVMSLALIPAVGNALFGTLIGLEGQVLLYARNGYAILVIVPYLQGWRSLSYGTLVALGDTGGIRTAAFARIGALGVALGIGVLHGGWPGIYVAAGATLLAEFTEVGVLQLSVRKVLARVEADI